MTNVFPVDMICLSKSYKKVLWLKEKLCVFIYFYPPYRQIRDILFWPNLTASLFIFSLVSRSRISFKVKYRGHIHEKNGCYRGVRISQTACLHICPQFQQSPFDHILTISRLNGLEKESLSKHNVNRGSEKILVAIIFLFSHSVYCLS